jgi:acid phosphatase
MGYADRQFTRLSMGRLLGDLTSRLQDRITKGTSDQLRLGLYGCHDTTLGGILNALQCFDDKWPVFTAYVSFELFKKSSSAPQTGGITSWLSSFSPPATQDYYVRFRYNSKDIKLPACSAPGNHLEGSDGTVCTCMWIKLFILKPLLR